MPVGIAAPQYIDGLVMQTPGSLGGADNDRARTVRDQATIEHGQRVRDHPGVDHLIDRQGFPGKRIRIELCPFARSHSHFCQLLACRAVLVHMASRRQRVAGHRIEGLVGMLVGLRVQLGAHLIDARATGRAAGRASVADQHVLALPRIDRHLCDLQVCDKGRATKHGAVGKPRTNAHVLRHAHHPPGRGETGSDDAVDIGFAQAAALDRHAGCLCDDFLLRGTTRMPHAGQAGTEDGDGASWRCCIHSCPPGAATNTSKGLSSTMSMRARTGIPIRTSSTGMSTTRLMSLGPSSRVTSTTV